MFERISETFSFFARHWWGVGIVVWAFAFPSLLLDLLLDPPVTDVDESGMPSLDFTSGFFLAQVLVMIILTPLSTVALPLKIRAILNQQEMSLEEAVKRALPLWFKAFVTLLLTGMIIFFGFMLFIFPGLYLMARLSYAPFYVAFESASPSTALQRSMEATRPDQWNLLGVLLVFWLLVISVHGILAGGLEALPWLSVMVQFVIAPLTALVTIAAMRFFDLHHHTYR